MAGGNGRGGVTLVRSLFDAQGADVTVMTSAFWLKGQKVVVQFESIKTHK